MNLFSSSKKFLFLYLILIYNVNVHSQNYQTGSGQSARSPSKPASNTNEKTTSVDIDKPWDTNYISDHSGSILTYVPRGNVSINIVKQGSKEIWKASDKEEHSNKVIADFAKNIVTVYIGTDGKSTKVFTKGSDKSWTEDTQASTYKIGTNTSGGSSEPGTKTGSKTGVELSLKATAETDQFNYKKDGKVVTYTAKDKYAFKSIKTKNMVVWESDKETEYASKVVLDGKGKKDKTVTIHLPNGTKKVFKREGKDKPWHGLKQPVKDSVSTYSTKTTVPSGQPAGTQGPAGSQTRSSSGPTQHSSSAQSQSSSTCVTVQSQSKASPTSGAQSQPGKSQPSSSTTPPITSGAGAPRLQSSSGTAPKTGSQQPSSTAAARTGQSSSPPPLLTGTQQTSSGQSPSSPPPAPVQPASTKQASSTSTPKATPISNDSDSKSQSPATKSDITEKTIQLDINKTSGTHEFDYEKKAKSAIYTPKDGSTFKLVKEDKTEIWKTVDATQYSNRVEVYFINKESKAVTIHLSENKNKLFIRNGQNQPWKDIDLTVVNPRLVNISYEHDTYFYNNELNDNVRTFTAKKGFAFKGAGEYVNGKIVEVWKTDKSDEYCTKILVTNYLSDKMTDITFTLSNKTRKRFIKVEVEPPGCQCSCSFCCFITCGLSGLCCKSKVLTWKELDLTKPIPVMLDITSKHECYEFGIKKVGSQVFEAKEGYVFNRVVKASTKIWNTTKESEYSSIVIRKDKDDEVTVYVGMGDKANPKVYKRTEVAVDRYVLKG